MNRRQRLVQQQFLNNEDEVIRRLESLYTQALNDINKKAQSLQDEINRLGTLVNLSADAEEKARFLSMQQSKVYQKQFQDALKKQIGSILDNMHVEEFKTVSEYLQTCYTDAFIGTLYDLQGQGIPLCFPLDQQSMIQAIQLDSKISEGLYASVGEDIAELKKNIAAEVSRGISTGANYAQVAKQIKNHMVGAYTSKTGGALYRAMLISRTEGHRVQVQAGMDACYKAKEAGADVVKQWDSTLDKRTRPSHQKVDGEIRELDAPFSNGLMFPGDPDGGAAEVCNCRCALLQRARWALDDEELETLKDRAAYYGLDKADSFEDFKKKYIEIKNSPDYNMSVKKIGIQFFAEMPKAKFLEYALNPDKAPDKARAFKEALGYDLDNYSELMKNIEDHINESRFVEKGDSGHGMRYEYIIELTGANGKKANVLTAWIQDGEKKRMTSVYVTKRKVTE